MITRDSLIKSIPCCYANNAEELAESILANNIYIGKVVYVVSRRRRSNTKMIQGKVTKITLGKDNVKYFSVEGFDEENHYYQGTFVESSINKNVFYDMDTAQKHVV